MNKKIIIICLLAMCSIGLTSCCLNHEWLDATCTSPKVCSKCGETEGNVLEHSVGEWETAECNFIEATKDIYKRCLNCSEVIEEQTVALDSFHNDTLFYFSVEEFKDRLNYVFDNETLLMGHKAVVKDSDGSIMIVVSKGNSSIFAFLADSEGNNMKAAIDRGIANVLVFCDEDASTEDLLSLAGVVMACDPKLKMDDALTILSHTLDAASDSSDFMVEKNGIKYVATTAGDYVIFSFRLYE